MWVFNRKEKKNNCVHPGQLKLSKTGLCCSVCHMYMYVSGIVYLFSQIKGSKHTK